MCWQDLGDRGSFCFCLWGQTEVTHWPPVVLCGSREGGSVGLGLGLGEGARGLPCTYRKQPALPRTMEFGELGGSVALSSAEVCGLLPGK